MSSVIRPLSSTIPREFHDKFMRHYETNLNKIMKRLEHSKIHGKQYRPDTATVREWIDRQYTSARKEACELLAKNTHYFTLVEVMERFEHAIEQALHMIRDKGRDTSMYYIFTNDKKGEIGQSVLLFSYYGYFVLVKHGISPEQIQFVDDVSIVDKVSEDPEYFLSVNCFLFDDFSYSGSQLNTYLNQVYTHLGDKVCMYICLAGCSSNAFYNVRNKHIITRYGKRSCYKKTTIMVNGRPQTSIQKFRRYPMIEQLPHDAYHLCPGFVLKTFYDMTYDKEITEEQEFMLCYFFKIVNVHLGCSIFFEHKLADDLSTMAYIIRYGFIIPPEYKVFVMRNDIMSPDTKTQAQFRAILQKEHAETDAYVREHPPETIPSPLEFVSMIPSCAEQDRPMLEQMKTYYTPILVGNTDIDYTKEVTKYVHIRQKHGEPLEKITESMVVDDLDEDSGTDMNDYLSDHVDFQIVLPLFDIVSNRVESDEYMFYPESTYFMGFTLQHYLHDIQVVQAIRKNRCPYSFYKDPTFFQFGGNRSSSSYNRMKRRTRRTRRTRKKNT